MIQIPEKEYKEFLDCELDFINTQNECIFELRNNNNALIGHINELEAEKEALLQILDIQNKELQKLQSVLKKYERANI